MRERGPTGRNAGGAPHRGFGLWHGQAAVPRKKSPHLEKLEVGAEGGAVQHVLGGILQLQL